MRLKYFKKLLSITKDQEMALIYEDIDKMKVLMEEKQEILEEIDKLNRLENKALTNEERDILIETKELDMKNNVEFKAQLNYAKEEVKKANILTRRENYYTNPYTVAMEGGIFFDRK